MKLASINNPHTATTRSPRHGRWVVVVLATVLILFVGLLVLFAHVAGAGAQGFMSPQMAAAYPTPKDVVGDLGGMPVRIARHIPYLASGLTVTSLFSAIARAARSPHTSAASTAAALNAMPLAFRSGAWKSMD